MAVVYKYGIDLGTTNSSIALTVVNSFNGKKEIKVFDVDYKNNPPKLLKSIVTYNEDLNFYVGNEALERLNSMNQSLVKNVKLAILQDCKDMKYLDTGYYYSDILAEILKVLKKKADAQNMGNVVNGVVMGIPNNTKQGVKDVYIKALIKAGFYLNEDAAYEQTDFIEEAVAVALYYGINTGHDKKRSLILDFGGGTLDIAVVDMNTQSLERDAKQKPHKVIAKQMISGAGEELTRLFFINGFIPVYSEQHFKGNRNEMAKLLKSFGFNAKSTFSEFWDDFHRDGDGWQLINAIELMKIALSSQDKYNFYFKSLSGKVILEKTTFTRDDFENSIRFAIEKVLSNILEFLSKLQQKNIDKSSIDEVLLAGGSSLIPLFIKGVEKLFPRKVYTQINVSKTVADLNIMTAIVQGLAWYGYQDMTEKVLDITTHDYGFKDYETNQICVVLPANTPFSEAKFDQLTFGLLNQCNYSKNIRQRDHNASGFFVDIYEDNTMIMRLDFHKSEHSGSYKLIFSINPKNGSLEVHVYDLKLMRFIEDLSLDERAYKIVKM